MTGTTQQRPLLLLDVDGVVNAMPGWAPAPDYRATTIDGYRIHFHREVSAMVAALAEHFEIQWFTLWNDRAAPMIGPHVGLVDADHLVTSWRRGEAVLAEQGYSPEAAGGLMYAKTPLLPELVGTDRRWVWIDDAHSVADLDYLIDAGFDPNACRLIATDESVGLTWDEVDEAIAFALGGATSPSSLGTRDGAHHPGSAAGRTTAVGED